MFGDKGEAVLRAGDGDVGGADALVGLGREPVLGVFLQGREPELGGFAGADEKSVFVFILEVALFAKVDGVVFEFGHEHVIKFQTFGLVNGGESHAPFFFSLVFLLFFEQT